MIPDALRGGRGRDRGTPEESESSSEPKFSIGALASEFEITTRTIRFYEARGLISPARKGANRSYSRRDRARLMLILRGKNLGFSLEDIGEYLALYDSDPEHQAQTRLLLGKVEVAIADLEAKSADLERTLRDLRDIRTKCIEHLQPGERAGGSDPSK